MDATFIWAHLHNLRMVLVFLLLLPLLSACVSQTAQKNDQTQPFNFRDLGKSDIDLVVETHQREVFRHLRLLMEKLYRRNPRELKKNGEHSMEEKIELVFGKNRNWRSEELQGKTGTDVIHVAFHNGYRGDRVLAFSVGLTSMLYAAYNNQSEFFIIDEVDPQKLYNSARNVEIAVWKLGNDRNPRGRPYLLSNSLPGESRNLSFERLFGKIIGLQDTLAR
ncbi:MAG: hypothetical protein GY731_09355, partial [Gammaproteobacteria bacterium]|nr:hypothetical protein [Gammaproteobacteria bacterium]